MSRICPLKQLHGLNLLRVKPRGALSIRVVSFHSVQDSSSVDEEEVTFTPEWYEKAFLKLKKWTHILKNLDLIEGKLVDVNQNKRIYDDKLEKNMRVFKEVARIFIGHPSMLQSIRNNAMSPLHTDDLKREPPFMFARPAERQPMTVDTLTKIATYMNVSVQQRKVVRFTICPQVTHYHVWVSTLEEILNRLKSEIDGKRDNCSSKGLRLAEQIVFNCLKILDSVISFDPESTSWMRLAPKKDRSRRNDPPPPPPPYTWEDIVQMFNDLIRCLDEEKDFSLHLEKVEAMKEGLYQIRDFPIDKNIGYKENRYKESLVQRQLSKTLGHSSRCLYTLLLYYLCDIVNDPEVDVCGAVYPRRGRGNRFYLCMGKILTSTEEKMLQNGMKQLDTALKLFKFVWETAGMKGDLELQGHLFCVGANSRLLLYRGNSFFLHDLNL